mmetsp:Transcript_57141/g.127565  ORF Transcript_57141/g.127565 Transcript_57141/m.127565 type:complete len:218 (-) Transcript_57141:342-995(-)
MFASLVINFSQRRQPYAFQLSHSASLPAVEAYLQLLSELGRVDSEHGPKLTEALEVFYQENCVEEEPGKFRCPLSGKLFKDAVFVRKHIDNKHPDALLKAKVRSLEDKYLQYFLANRLAPAPPLPSMPPPPPYVRDSLSGPYRVDSRGSPADQSPLDKFDSRMGKGRGAGRPQDGGGRYALRDFAPPPPRPTDTVYDGRAMVQYRDLDAPDEDDLFS